MSAVTLEEAQARLPELIDKLLPGERLLITRNEQTIASVEKEAASPPKPRQPGCAAGQLIILAEDDEHLKDFREYMP